MSLSPIRAQRKLRKFLTYDLEWIPGRLDVRLVGVYDGRRYRCYRSVAAFLDGELTSQNRGKWFYAHAGGLADVQFVLHELIKREVAKSNISVHASFSGSSAIIVRVTRGKHQFYFIDSYWLLKDKLRNIARWIGLEKGGEEESIDGFPVEGPRIFYAPMAVLRDYNASDCEILWKAIDAFETAVLELGGQLQMTQASCAMYLFRRKYLSRTIDTSNALNGVARRAYVASRVEVFRRHCRKKAYYYDINSSFPAAMTRPCPGNLIAVGRSIPRGEGRLYLALATVRVPESFLPPLPYRSEKSGRVYFPTGEWTEWFCNVDLELLERQGGQIVNVQEVRLFDEFTDISAYALDLYARRAASQSDFEKVALKLLLNSLYGKFGEGSEKTSIRINPAIQPFCEHRPPCAEDRATGRPACVELMFPGVWQVSQEMPVEHAHVPISAHITALARKSLYDYLLEAVRLGGEKGLYYSDTDSVITEAALPTDAKKLGALKLEDTLLGGEFLAPKIYAIETESSAPEHQWAQHEGRAGAKIKVRAKGFSRMTYEKFCALRDGDEIEIERMVRLRELYRSGDSRPLEKTYLKRLTGETQAKRASEPGGGTRPWRVSEIK